MGHHGPVARLAEAVQAINRKNGHNTIRVAVQGYAKGWELKQEYISKQYTTNLEDVIVLKIK
jgi:DNA polymerase V